jgi:hypothetical protein
MSEQVVEDVEDLAQPTANGELVHWMGRKPIAIGPAGLSVAVASGFALGVAATLAVLGLSGWLGPEREIEILHRR